MLIPDIMSATRWSGIEEGDGQEQAEKVSLIERRVQVGVPDRMLGLAVCNNISHRPTPRWYRPSRLLPSSRFRYPPSFPLSRRPDRYTDAARLSTSRSHSSLRVPGSPSSRLHRYPPLPRQVISGNTSSGLYADESNHLPVPPVSSIVAMNSGSIRPTSFLSPGTFVVSYRSCQSESQSHQSMYLRSALNRPKRIAPMKVL
jgi:hypothetical protein